MKNVPVLLGFDQRRIIGHLSIDETQLPDKPNYHFGLGYQALALEMDSNEVISHDLVCVSVILDKNFSAGYTQMRRTDPSFPELQTWALNNGWSGSTDQQAYDAWLLADPPVPSLEQFKRYGWGEEEKNAADKAAAERRGEVVKYQDRDPSEDGAVYSEGICEDGAAILKNGVMMTITEVLNELNRR